MVRCSCIADRLNSDIMRSRDPDGIIIRIDYHGFVKFPHGGKWNQQEGCVTDSLCPFNVESSPLKCSIDRVKLQDSCRPKVKVATVGAKFQFSGGRQS